MTAKAKWRGHDIESVNKTWRYSDTKQNVSENQRRKCGHCENEETKEGHDACLGTLPGIMNACCGHGVEGDAYVQYPSGDCMRGIEAVEAIHFLKEHRDSK